MFNCGGQLIVVLTIFAYQSQAVTYEDVLWGKHKFRYGTLIHDVDPTSWLRECVPPLKHGCFPTDPFPTANCTVDPVPYSNYYSKQMPSGLCSDALACAFKTCEWTDEAKDTLMAHDLQVTTFNEVRDHLPPLNLPGKITFPQNVRDVVDVVQYAASHNIGISVKNGGHSYTGAFTMKDSIQFNMRSFPKYSRSSIQECSVQADTPVCQLALARGKKAVIRVGGGEVWDDVYRAVIDWNNMLPRQNTYEVMGGGAGTVSAAGGWLQGGGLSIGFERMFGFGVDQVLAIEMVLPNGMHVKFGPSKWEQVEGFHYPRTTKVEGHCNQNPDEDESKWKWQDCRDRIPFSDLWFAVRGGGGGTWGIVTAVHLQLHENQPLWSIVFNTSIHRSLTAKCEQAGTCDAIQRLLVSFLVKLLYDPGSVDVSEQVSNSCGHNSLVFSLSGFQGLYCRDTYPSPRATVLRAWGKYVARKLKVKAELQPVAEELKNLFEMKFLKSFAEDSILDNIRTGAHAPIGHVTDNGFTGTFPVTRGCWSALVPKQFVLQTTGDEVREDVYDLLINSIGGEAHVTGGLVSSAHDQFTVLSEAYRNSAFQACIPDGNAHLKYRGLLHQFMQITDGQYPGDTEYNHVSPVVPGPLKTNWSTPCPSSFSPLEKEQKCISLVESVWGTELLTKLERIKQAVDPKGLFKCNGCIGADGKFARHEL